MAFRHGVGGTSEWINFRGAGVACITYPQVEGTNFSRYSEKQAISLLKARGLAPAQKYSLRMFVYEMQTGDTIYVKEGPNIVGRGTIVSDYRFSPHNVKGGSILPWRHQRRVDWQEDFVPTTIWVGKTQNYAIRLLSVGETKILIREINAERNRLKRKITQAEAIEGAVRRRETQFRLRNRNLIEQKKAGSDYRCEVCGFFFERFYGDRGSKYIIAHHTKPLGGRKRASQTRIEDIALICANCHTMLHRDTPPISIEKLRREATVGSLRKLLRKASQEG